MARRSNNSSSTRNALIVGGVIVAVAAGAFLYTRSHKTENAVGPTAQANGLPLIQNKQKPVDIDFEGCPPEGDGGDPALNRLKNRSDEATWIPVQFDALEKLTWPKAIERLNRTKWSGADAEEISRYEGIPVSVEGYLFGAKEEGPESPNCHGDDHKFHDYHIWLTKNAGEDRTESIVVEVTPRLHAKHPAWTLDALRKVIRANQRVRISGWLMLDPEHPDQVGKTRGTIWEIHPIMKIEVQQSGRWTLLDTILPS